MALVRDIRINRNFGPNIGVKASFIEIVNSVRSPRDVWGNLVLRANPLNSTKCVVDKVISDPRFTIGAGSWNGADFPPGPGFFDAAYTPLHNEALARFTGKVRKHNASLGVTLGSWRESRNMITDRTQKIQRIFDTLGRRLERDIAKMSPKQRAARRRRLSMDRASDFLEGEFGWIPLVQDVQAAFGALAQTPQSKWIASRSTGTHRKSSLNMQVGAEFNTAVSEEGNLSLTVSAKCSFDSPNVFLANRLGLLALPGVAWDLIPWSFVVNMFTNMGQLVNSVTDFVGVTVSDVSVTKSAFITQQTNLWATAVGNQRGSFGYCEVAKWKRDKYRELSANVPKPVFQLKVPELNLELAGIAIALILQKMARINRLVGDKLPFLNPVLSK